MQNLLAAANNGSIDLNNPAMQQIKSLVMLQQQQRQGQMAMNPTAAAAVAAQTDQQRVRSGSVSDAAPNAAAATPSQKAWTGDITWQTTTNGVQNIGKLDSMTTSLGATRLTTIQARSLSTHSSLRPNSFPTQTICDSLPSFVSLVLLTSHPPNATPMARGINSRSSCSCRHKRPREIAATLNVTTASSMAYCQRVP
jgi:hypothetical protein